MSPEQRRRLLDLLSPTPGCACETCKQIRAAKTLLLLLGKQGPAGSVPSRSDDVDKKWTRENELAEKPCKEGGEVL